MMVIPYDIPLLTSIQCAAAAELGIEPGFYFHTSASLHAYEDEIEVLREVASGSVSSASTPRIPNLAELMELTVFEKDVRRSFENGTIRSFAKSAALGTAMDYSSIVRSILLGDALWRGGAPDQAKLAWATAGRIGQLAAARYVGKDVAP
jgi:thymidylate synthase